jgi:hypothetical protein
MFKDIICPAQRRMFLGELKTFRHERSIFLKASVRQDAQRGESASASVTKSWSRIQIAAFIRAAKADQSAGKRNLPAP